MTTTRRTLGPDGVWRAKPFIVVQPHQVAEFQKALGSGTDVIADKPLPQITGVWIDEYEQFDRAARHAAIQQETAMNQNDKIEACAQAAHEANRAYCSAIGDNSQPSWSDAPHWQKDSAIAGVRGVLNGNTPEQSHESWLKGKADAGWTYGPVKDPDSKTHPCFVPYAELQPEQKAKDHVYVAVVKAMAEALGLEVAPHTPPVDSQEAGPGKVA